MQLLLGTFVFRVKSNSSVMKKATLFGLMLAIGLTAMAQEREYQTLANFDNARISGQGGPFMQFTGIDGEFAHMLGGGGAILLGDFWFGGYGIGLTNRVYVDEMSHNSPNYDYNSGDYLNVSHGGFWMGYSLFGDFPVHVAISSLVGWGQISVSNEGYASGLQDGVFVICPTLEVELNLTRFFRLGVGASYNIYTFVDSYNLPGYSSSDFSAPGGFMSFKFGWF
jgi:hypothetical protein